MIVEVRISCVRLNRWRFKSLFSVPFIAGLRQKMHHVMLGHTFMDSFSGSYYSLLLLICTSLPERGLRLYVPTVLFVCTAGEMIVSVVIGKGRSR